MTPKAQLDVVLGLQWGDEGKGKIVDVLADTYEVVARFQGGPNAGHSLKFEDTTFVLHSVPSGIFRENSTNIIGNGVVLDPIIFEEECRSLEKSEFPSETVSKYRRKHILSSLHTESWMQHLKALREKRKSVQH